MEELIKQPLSLDQWFQMFVLAMGILVFCSLVIMISIWVVSAKLTDINEKLDQLPHSEDKGQKKQETTPSS